MMRPPRFCLTIRRAALWLPCPSRCEQNNDFSSPFGLTRLNVQHDAGSTLDVPRKIKYAGSDEGIAS
jgi:hypothetical protein